MRKNDQTKSLSAHYLNNRQIDDICNVLTDIYTEKKMDEGTIITQIDIEDFTTKILGCKIVYECIAEEVDCLGFMSDGTEYLPVNRDGKTVNVLFPKDTIVIDKFLNDPSQLNRKRFTIAHEAGHVIKNRMYGNTGPEYNHAGGIILDSAHGLHKRYSIKEVEANNFAASLLMPEGMVAMLMHKLYGCEQIVKYQNDIIDGEDAKRISLMARILGVSYTAMFYRLKTLGFVLEGELETYVEENVLGDNNNE